MRRLFLASLAIIAVIVMPGASFAQHRTFSAPATSPAPHTSGYGCCSGCSCAPDYQQRQHAEELRRQQEETRQRQIMEEVNRKLELERQQRDEAARREREIQQREREVAERRRHESERLRKEQELAHQQAEERRRIESSRGLGAGAGHTSAGGKPSHPVQPGTATLPSSSGQGMNQRQSQDAAASVYDKAGLPQFGDMARRNAQDLQSLPGTTFSPPTAPQRQPDLRAAPSGNPFRTSPPASDNPFRSQGYQKGL
jgi:hypothetical protein